MRFVLFVEGYTEKKGIGGFLKRYLDPPRLRQPVGIKVIRFDGWSDLLKDLPQHARLHLDDPKHGKETIGLLALLDLYGPTIYPGHASTADQRAAWAKKHFESAVGHPRFRMFFAVHEVEAWFLSNPSLFPEPLRRSLKTKAGKPEGVDFDCPPKVLRKSLYREKLKRNDQEVTHGSEFFSRLDPAAVAGVCPQFRLMIEEMVAMAGDAGLVAR